MKSLIICLALAGCSLPHYVEITPGYSMSEFAEPAPEGRPVFSTTGIALTIGWNLQAERHHRESMMEHARETGRIPFAMMPAEKRKKEEDALTKAAAALVGGEAPDPEKEGWAYARWAAGVSLILLMLAVLRWGPALWKRNGKAKTAA